MLGTVIKRSDDTFNKNITYISTFAPQGLEGGLNPDESFLTDQTQNYFNDNIQNHEDLILSSSLDNSLSDDIVINTDFKDKNLNIDFSKFQNLYACILLNIF